MVRKEPKLKTLSTRHCFNQIADSKDAFLSLKAMDKVVALNPQSRSVTILAGMSYGQLCPYLHAQGFALHNLASLPHISVVGACSTATHGSGERNGNLATSVSAMELVTAAGEIVYLSRQADGERFCAAVVGLGAFGVITKITLNIEPAFEMRQDVYENLPLKELANNFDAIEASGYSVSLFTDWQQQRIGTVWIKNRVEHSEAAKPAPDFFGAKLAGENLHPIPGISAENCTEQMGVPGPWYERLPHFRMGFLPSAGEELQSEYFVPRQHAVEAVLAVERLRDKITPPLLITEIRAIAADDLWLSPCYKQACIAIHFTWNPEWNAVKKLLPEIERELAPFHARPHWGKLFTMSAQQLRSLYEKLPEFAQLARQFDPEGKFRNDFLQTYIFDAE